MDQIHLYQQLAANNNFMLNIQETQITPKSYSPEELINLTSSQLLDLIQEAKHASLYMGIKWAESKRLYKNLKELMPSFLAAITKEIVKRESLSHSQARQEALASLHYQNKIKEMNQAEYEMNKAEVNYRGYLKTLEAISSICYVRNNELKLAR